MVLLIGNQALSPDPDGVLERVLESPELKQSCARFLDSAMTLDRHTPAVHVFQGELARVPTAGAAHYIGSTDATTCVIVAFFDGHAGLATVAHFDGSSAASTASMQACLEGLATPALYLVGGYRESSGMGVRTCTSLLRFFHASPLSIALRLACIGGLNTDAAGAPRCQSLAVDLHTGGAHPTSFADRGPLALPRLAQLWLREGAAALALQQVYDAASDRLVVPLILGLLDRELCGYLRYLLALSPPQFLQLVSTSPEHEGPGFLEDMQGALSWLLGQDGPHRIETYAFAWGPDGWQAAPVEADERPVPVVVGGQLVLRNS